MGSSGGKDGDGVKVKSGGEKLGRGGKRNAGRGMKGEADSGVKQRQT